MSVVYDIEGFCPACEKPTRFVAPDATFRETLICVRCCSLPRQRALHRVLNRYYPQWKKGWILETAPINHLVALQCNSYTATIYFPEKPFGSIVHGFRNEDIQNMTFEDNMFDFSISMDVMEHIFDPKAAILEQLRVVKPGGAVVFTTPRFDNMKSLQRARLIGNQVEHLEEPDYHGSYLVTWYYGEDFFDQLKEWSNAVCCIIGGRFPSEGIDGKHIDVFVVEKPQDDQI